MKLVLKWSLLVFESPLETGYLWRRQPSREGHGVETAVLVLVGSAVMGAASAFVLSAIGMFFGSLIFVISVFALPEPLRPDGLTVVGALVSMQLAYVATGWLRGR